MTASYPMYALPQLQPGLVVWWQHIFASLRAREIKASKFLTKVDSDLYKHWLDPQLFFSQTCGYPLTTVLKNNVKLVGTPVYDSEYCLQADYCSLFIVRLADNGNFVTDYAGKRFTFNGTDSQSGFNAVKTYLAEQCLSLPFFGENIVSGTHINSIAKVANNEADICAVDCVTYALLQRHQPKLLKNTRVLATTGLTPGLPFITSVNTSDEIIQALYEAIAHTCETDSLHKINSNLLIKGISKISLGTYMQMINPATPPIDKL